MVDPAHSTLSGMVVRREADLCRNLICRPFVHRSVAEIKRAAHRFESGSGDRSQGVGVGVGIAGPDGAVAAGVPGVPVPAGDAVATGARGEFVPVDAEQQGCDVRGAHHHRDRGEHSHEGERRLGPRGAQSLAHRPLVVAALGGAQELGPGAEATRGSTKWGTVARRNSGATS